MSSRPPSDAFTPGSSSPLLLLQQLGTEAIEGRKVLGRRGASTCTAGEEGHRRDVLKCDWDGRGARRPEEQLEKVLEPWPSSAMQIAIDVRPGYYLSPNTSAAAAEANGTAISVWLCAQRASCLGGTLVGDASCAEGHSGALCGSARR